MRERLITRLRSAGASPRFEPAIAIALLLATAASFVIPGPAGFVAVPLAALAAYRIGARRDGRRGLLAVVLGFVVLEVALGPSANDWVPVILAVSGPYGLGHQIGGRRRMVAALAERAAELEAEEDAFARLSVRRERARIARDLHDIVAHHLAVIVVQAGAGRIASTPAPARTQERFAAIHRAGDQALGDMARLVDLIQREGSVASGGLAKLRMLVEEAEAGGLDVRLRTTLPPADVPPEVGDTAFRVVQEGLTNAIKHAPSAPVAVRVVGTHDMLEVEVRDEGSAHASALGATGSGLGLTGMHERVESLGGRLDAGPSEDGGWSLHARLPLSARALAPLG